MVGVGVIGAGYWGPNLIRNFAESAACRLVGVCDLNAANRQAVSKQYPGTVATAECGELLSNPDVNAMVIATPAKTHFDLALRCLESGKHVFVEKPLALSPKECRTLIDTARSRNLCLMVGHTFLYNAAVVRIKDLIQEGALGEVLYVYCQRLNLGKVRDDLDVMWNLAPHDISILCYWLGALPTLVRAQGYSYLQHGLADVAFVTMDFPRRVGASIHVSWLDPGKIRRITIVGTRKMLVYDDVSLDQKIVIYDKGVSTSGRHDGLNSAMDRTYDDFRIELREGDISIPHLRVREPLKVECDKFIEYVTTGKPPVSDGQNGLDVVRVLEACSFSMANGGNAWTVNT